LAAPRLPCWLDNIGLTEPGRGRGWSAVAGRGGARREAKTEKAEPRHGGIGGAKQRRSVG